MTTVLLAWLLLLLLTISHAFELLATFYFFCFIAKTHLLCGSPSKPPHKPHTPLLISQANKVPQERVPADVAAKITGEMLDAFQQLLGPAGTVKLPKPVFTRWAGTVDLVACLLHVCPHEKGGRQHDMVQAISNLDWQLA